MKLKIKVERKRTEKENQTKRCLLDLINLVQFSHFFSLFQQCDKMSSKSKLKEKILSWYDGLFELDKGLLNDHKNFWQEFFLLRPKSEYLSEKIKNLNTPQALQLLVDQCLEFSSTGSTIQVANALQTQV